MAKSIKEIEVDFKKAKEYSCKVESITKLKEGYIFDEDKSVKWNREEVIRNNEEYEKVLKEKQQEKNKLYVAAEKEVFEYIDSYVGKKLDEKKKGLIWGFTKDYMSAASTWEQLQNLDDLVELLSTLLN